MFWKKKKVENPSFLTKEGRVKPEIEIGSRYSAEEQQKRLLELVESGKTVAEAEELLRKADFEDNLDSYISRK